MTRPVGLGVVLAMALSLGVAGCDSARHDQLDTFAAASCASIQTWIDAVEDETVALSRHVTPLDDSADRVVYYREFAHAIDLRTWDLLRQLKRIAPAHGDGRIAADSLIASIEASRGVTQELIDLADSFPDRDDPEGLTGRISSMFIRLEKAFALPNRARDDLAERYPAFDDLPACADYVNPVS
jgi:hypothetical protein